MNIFRILCLGCFGLYGTLSNIWFGWTFRSPEFWTGLTLMVLVSLFSSLEDKYDR